MFERMGQNGCCDRRGQAARAWEQTRSVRDSEKATVRTNEVSGFNNDFIDLLLFFFFFFLVLE